MPTRFGGLQPLILTQPCLDVLEKDYKFIRKLHFDFSSGLFCDIKHDIVYCINSRSHPYFIWFLYPVLVHQFKLKGLSSRLGSAGIRWQVCWDPQILACLVQVGVQTCGFPGSLVHVSYSIRFTMPKTEVSFPRTENLSIQLSLLRIDGNLRLNFRTWQGHQTCWNFQRLQWNSYVACLMCKLRVQTMQRSR